MSELQTQKQHAPFPQFDPHRILGLHSKGRGQKVIRLFRPGAEEVHIELSGEIRELECTDIRGLFELAVPKDTVLSDYRIYHQNGLLAHDPYAFLPTFSDFDAYLFGQGVNYELFNVFGARLCEQQDVQGVKFALWAPNAQSVSLVGDFNHWNGKMNPMRSLGGVGVWELFVPGLKEGDQYKFELRGHDGRLRIKADPFAYASQMRPNTASVVCDVDRHVWSDEKWLKKRVDQIGKAQPMTIYEVHLGSWKKRDGNFLNYRELAHQLADYCKRMGYTHVELLPLNEHPLDESWGYQVTGFFAVTSRYGTPADFQYFVDYLHGEEIGVIIDWVAAHFPTDDFALAQFDGTYLFEHADPRQGFHPHWNTHIFNYGRKEVSNFLIASALFWLDKMHIDGIRVDAVASMLYLDYGREKGEWIPNKYGGNHNLEAIEFLKHFNSVMHKCFPGCLTIAEESTAFLGVTQSLEWGGLGFDMKWNMGWMNDTVRYFGHDPVYRHFHHNELVFSIVYAFSEKFALVLSHDEVVHGKHSMLAKMPGDEWQKFANLRLLYSYMMCHPGKNLFFMSSDFGQWNEWNVKKEIEWFLLSYPIHAGLHKMIENLNHFYLKNRALWENDFSSEGFEWINCSDSKNCVISYLRKSRDSYLACVHNFTPHYFDKYEISLAKLCDVQEVFNTDEERFGGSGKVKQRVFVNKNGFTISLAPLATMVFEVRFED